MSLKSLVLDLIRWDNAGTNPLSGRKDTGRAVAERIPAGEYNWFKNQFYLFLSTITNAIRNSFSIYLAAYYGNIKLGDDMQDESAWASILGTQSADSTNVKIGDYSLRITENDNVASDLFSNLNGITLDLTKLENGETSGDSDFILYTLYISDVSLVDKVGIGFSQDASYTNANIKFKDITTGLSTGWNFLKIQKSDFSTIGIGAWDNIQSMSVLWTSLINAQNEYVSFQFAQLVKKDPSLSIPNPFQRFGINDFEIDSGEWFVFKEFGEIVLRELSGVNAGFGVTDFPLYANNQFSDFTSQYRIKKIDTANKFGGIGWRVDSANNVRVMGFPANTISLIETIGGVDNTIDSKSVNINNGDIFDIEVNKDGQSFSVNIIKNGKLSNPVMLSGDTSLSTSLTGSLAFSHIGDTYENILVASITEISFAAKAGTAEVAKEIVNTWKDYIPTLTFTGTPPASITTVARYRQIGNKVDFNISLSSADGNGATDLRISVPVTPKDNNSIVSVSSQEKVDTIWSNPLGYINDDSGLGIQFRNFSTATDAVVWEIIITGSYEV